MRALQSALLFLSLLETAHADVVREPNGALLCETAKELAMALTTIRNQTQPDHNLRCWNVAPGSQLIVIKAAGPYLLVRQPYGSAGFTLSAWLDR